MEDISIAQAKEHLEELIARAGKGEEVLITDPVLGTVRLQNVSSTPHKRQKRVAGHLAGQFKVPDGLLDPLPDDELRRWTGEDQ